MGTLTAVLWVLVVPGAAAPPAPVPTGDSYVAARSRMVREQIRDRGIRDTRLLEAMSRVPRHELVPAPYRHLAYEDTPLPIGEGQTVSQPFVVAYMTERLHLTGDERVLEVGTGSGYQAAVLAELGGEIYTIEIVPSLARRAAADLARLGYTNVQVREGDGYRGWPEAAPFDAIIVTAAPDRIPDPLLEQLAVGGRMIIPLGEEDQRLVLVERKPEGLKLTDLLPVRFVPMTGEIEKQAKP